VVAVSFSPSRLSIFGHRGTLFDLDDGLCRPPLNRGFAVPLVFFYTLRFGAAVGSGYNVGRHFNERAPGRVRSPLAEISYGEGRSVLQVPSVVVLLRVEK